MTSVGVTIGCAPTGNAAELQVGDCLEMGGTDDQPRVEKAECGSATANFKVVSSVTSADECPVDVDSTYSMRDSLNRSASTLCLDIDWMLGGCMSVDPRHDRDPVRVDCADTSVRPRQRATQILSAANGPFAADQCASGLGYTYSERGFTVCVENLG
ncbi:LppU family putative lipoprotein [Mycolicibacillus koreensis]|uniref:LppU family putative lipoprotein n=1 Tax=Mycolicibacillus koreensis TaxID=1069220 RepID=UPI0023AB4C6B